MKSSSVKQLKKLLDGKIYFRLPDTKRRKLEGQAYKHGYEVRLVVNNKIELKKMQSILKNLGFDFGKPYAKGLQIIQPVYGKYQIENLRSILR